MPCGYRWLCFSRSKWFTNTALCLCCLQEGARALFSRQHYVIWSDIRHKQMTLLLHLFVEGGGAGNFHCDLTRPHLNLRQFNTGVPNIRAVCRNWAGKDANRIWPTFNCIFISFTAFLSTNKNLLFYNYGSVSLMTTQSFFWYLTHLLLLDFLQQHCFVM